MCEFAIACAIVCVTCQLYNLFNMTLKFQLDALKMYMCYFVDLERKHLQFHLYIVFSPIMAR